MRKLYGTLAALAVAVLTMLPAAALAQTYPPASPTPSPTETVAEGVVCTPESPAPGDQVTCTATGFQPGSQVQVTITGGDADRSTTVTADGSGTVRVTFTVPSTADAGDTIQVTFSGVGADGQPLVLGTSATVAAAPGDGAAIPATGSNVTNGMILAAVAIVLGGSLLYVARRRSRRSGEPTA